MTQAAEPLVAPLRRAELALTRGARRQRRRFRYHVHRGHVWFDREVRLTHKRFRQSLRAFVREVGWINLLTTPIIYSLALPLMLLDVWVTAYQRLCFPIYGIPHVRRGRYLVIDRHKLGYLNVIEKANCMYCSYATGVIGYVREIAARTEQYWCPIKHSRRLTGVHSRYQRFLDYGDAEQYRSGLRRLRQALREQAPVARQPSLHR